MTVPGNDCHEMDQGVGGQETCASDRSGPVRGPPCPCTKRETGDKECRADVLDKVRIIRAGLGYPWNARVPGWARSDGGSV